MNAPSLDDQMVARLDEIPVEVLRRYLNGRLVREQHTGEALRREVERLTARADPEADAYLAALDLEVDADLDADLTRRTAEMLRWMDQLGTDREFSLKWLRNALRDERGGE